MDAERSPNGDVEIHGDGRGAFPRTNADRGGRRALPRRARFVLRHRFVVGLPEQFAARLAFADSDLLDCDFLCRRRALRRRTVGRRKPTRAGAWYPYSVLGDCSGGCWKPTGRMGEPHGLVAEILVLAWRSRLGISRNRPLLAV